MREPALRFGGTTPPEIDRRLRDAVYAAPPRAEQLLLDAQRLDPECLPVYFALYKFYFYRSRLADAERITLRALETAARQAAFPADWTALGPDSADWADVTGPAHFYLFSLKALAFIRLRQGRTPEARALLAKLAKLDPRDSVGSSVIGSLAAATAGAA
jgi:tetratricopeptide (TPR) repeat protein